MLTVEEAHRKYIEIKERIPVPKNRINLYLCCNLGCERSVVTIDTHDGTTPFKTRCVYCDGIMASFGYHVDQNLVPTHEWYRPTNFNEFANDQQTLDHLSKGGLILRKINCPIMFKLPERDLTPKLLCETEFPEPITIENGQQLHIKHSIKCDEDGKYSMEILEHSVTDRPILILNCEVCGNQINDVSCDICKYCYKQLCKDCKCECETETIYN